MSIYSQEMKTYVYTNVHRNIIPNSQKMESVEISTNWQMDRQIWYIHIMGYHFTLKRNLTTGTCYIMHDPQNHFVK